MSSSPSTTPVKVLILGHSFVRRLRVHTVVNGMFNLNLSRKGHTIVFRGVGGLKFAPLLRNLRNFCASGFDVVVFDFGTNDLAEGCAVDILVDRVGAVVDTLLASYGVKQVVVLEIFPRMAGRYPYPDNFNEKVISYNNALRERAMEDSRFHVHHHQGMVNNFQQYLLDGVHLNATGMAKYAKSVRRAVLKYSARHRL